MVVNTETIQAQTPDKPDVSNIIDPNNFSSYTSLLKVTAIAKRCLRMWITRTKADKSDVTNVSAQEMKDAETLWIKSAQLECYRTELDVLQNRGTTGRFQKPTKSSKRSTTLINQLRLFLDESGLIRLDGRLNNASLDSDTKFPYLIPKHHAVTELLIRRAHVQTKHSGMRSTVTQLRQRYWIPTIRQVVNTKLRHCTICKLASGKPYSKPETPPLQASRVREAPPFTVTGCDFTGALYVVQKEGGAEMKVYIALFTCAITRAVHLEIVPDMTTQAFLNAFRRFSARRSTPTQMISDNALTFTSAADYIKSLLNDPAIREYMREHQINWSFNPKRAPWWGGFFERLIGLTKIAIQKTLRRSRITMDQLVTLVTEIECALNNRPLTYIDSMDVTEALTPAHLLHGRQLTMLPHETCDMNDPDYHVVDQSALVTRSKKLASIFERFWQSWSSEYITALRERHIQSKVGSDKNIAKVGDVVLVHSDDVKRVNWKLAKIESLIFGNDGIARAARIKTQNGITNRPLARLYPLEITANTENMPCVTQETLNHNDADHMPRRSVRTASKLATEKIKHWAKSLNDDSDE